jgi:hypothetical protein
MAAVKTIGKIFGMFDRVDDIIYEPVKLVCEALRQPLKQVDAHNEKSKAEHQQALEQQLKEFETDLELSKKRREMEMDIDKRRMEEEIVQMIADNDMRRREEMIQMEMRYRKEMAEAATRLEQIMVNMQVDTRSKIVALYYEKTREYLEIQTKFEDRLNARVEQMKKMFPGKEGEERMLDYYYEQLDVIQKRSSDFLKNLDDDMFKVMGTIDDGMKEMTGLATKYFKPAVSNEQAITQNVVNAIEDTAR